MNVSIAICDDSEIFVKQLYLEIISTENQNCIYEVDTYNSGNQLMESLSKGKSYDIIFLDIDLGDSLGTDIGISLKKINPNILIIYISFYDSYYEKVARAEPFDFLRKPFYKEKLQQTLESAINRLCFLKQDFYYNYHSHGISYQVNLKDVMYFESQHRVVKIHSSNNSIGQFYGKLDDVEMEVNNIYPYFVRVNKSYFVNYKFITSRTNTAIQINGMTLKIGKNYRESFNKKVIKLNFI